MRFGSKVLEKINPMFPAVVHPFNLQNDGTKTYAMWQYEKGENTIAFYLKKYSTKEMFQDKLVLDLGCGAGGKSLYYASLGAKKVVGVDIVPAYEEESAALAKELGLEDKFQFVLGDAAALPLESATFDTVIMNDAMEHVAQPERVLKEALRLLRPGGRIYVNFPPYNHPFGAHLSDVIFVPWVHLFFSDKTLIEVYKDLVKDLPDAEERIHFRISKNEQGEEYFSYINKMSIKRFQKILRSLNITPVYYAETPLRSFFAPLAKLPGLKEMFVKMVACVIEKR